MQSFLFQVLFALSSLILSKAQKRMGSDTLCLASSPADDGVTRVTFLREDAAGVSSLYLSWWSEDMHLVTCEINTNSLVTESYRALCDEGSGREEILQMFNISNVLAPDAPCAVVSSSSTKFTKSIGGDVIEEKTRRKRSWIFPGTLWCGTGSTAVRYDQLGMFESADRCCREHDHCLHVIPALTMKYGIFNSNFFTVSHCDCDLRFRQCLLGVNDSISSMVGYSFFSFLQVPCFELKPHRRCNEKHWWGMCKTTEEALYAVLQSPLPYNTTAGTSKYGGSTDSSQGQNVTQGAMINPHTIAPKSEHRLISKDPPRDDILHASKTNQKGCKKHRNLSTVAPAQIPSMSRECNTTPAPETSHLRDSNAVLSNKKRAGKKKHTRNGTTKSYLQTTTTTQIPLTELHLPTAIAARTETTKSYNKAANQNHCCREPMRGDTFHLHCKNCSEPNVTSNVTAVTPSTTAHGRPVKVAVLQVLKKTTELPEQDTGSAAASAAPTTVRLNTAATNHKQISSSLPWSKPSRDVMEATKTPNTDAVGGLKLYFSLHNMTDKELQCSSLRHLDDCRYKIRPLKKKYNLHNTETKTAFHCDCTSRLALQIESFKQPSIVPELLMDFVSQYCFRLPKEKECNSRKSCSRGFTKASDILQALKKIKEKDTVGVQKSDKDRKRGIPVRLYKRCLRLEKGAAVMAQLT